MSELLNSSHLELIKRQKMFFVATAPLGHDTHINLSPKGLDSFRVLSPNRVAYLDVVGSGNETSAHLLENGRITIMFCSFDPTPGILRIYGQGRTVLPHSPDWSPLASLFSLPPNIRQIFEIEVKRVQLSCGYGVPEFGYLGERENFNEWCRRRNPDMIAEYQRAKNRKSLDGLPTALDQWLDQSTKD